MRSILGFGLVLVACVACTTIEGFKKVATYTYEGEVYDVYSATSDDYVLGADEVYALVPKGIKPTGSAVVATCPLVVGDADEIKGCEKAFGKKLEALKNPKAGGDGGMY